MLSFTMAQLLVRNVSDETVEALKRRAATNQRSVEAEHRALLEETLDADRLKQVERFKARLDALHSSAKGKVFTPSEILIRESREEG